MMDWIERLRDAIDSTGSHLPEEERKHFSAWRRLPSARLDLPHARTRYVLVDVEATGFDADRDQLLAIGAVAVNGGLIDPADAFHVVLRQEAAGRRSEVVAGSFDASEALERIPPREAILAFLDFAGKSPLVSYRIALKAALIGRTAQDGLGTRPELTWIDLAPAVADLFPEHRDLPEDLDRWLAAFGIPVHRRHHAVADSYAMAQLLQVAIRRASARDVESAERLMLVERTRRKLRPA